MSKESGTANKSLSEAVDSLEESVMNFRVAIMRLVVTLALVTGFLIGLLVGVIVA